MKSLVLLSCRFCFFTYFIVDFFIIVWNFTKVQLVWSNSFCLSSTKSYRTSCLFLYFQMFLLNGRRTFGLSFSLITNWFFLWPIRIIWYSLTILRSVRLSFVLGICLLCLLKFFHRIGFQHLALILIINLLLLNFWKILHTFWEDTSIRNVRGLLFDIF